MQQSSYRTPQETDINQNILESNTLIASIKMPIDIFIGKSSVQTSIYVFKVGEEHDAKHMVKFIDFRNDGYARSNRRKSGSDVNLRDVDNAKGRYAEVADLVLYGKSYLKLFSENEYVEAVIDAKSGADWNFDQYKKIDTVPKLADFKKTVADYLACEISNILKGQGEEADALKKANAPLEAMLNNAQWGEFTIGDLFEKRTIKGFPKQDENLRGNKNGYHIFGQNIKYQHEQKVLLDEKYLHHVDERYPILAYTSSVAEVGMIAEPFYRSGDNGAFQGLFPKFEEYNKRHIIYLWAELGRWFKDLGYGTSMAKALDINIYLPIKNEVPDFDFMEQLIELLEADRLRELVAYLDCTNLKDTKLTTGEEAAIELLVNGGVEWDKFSLLKLFGNATRGRRLKSADRINGDLPFVTAGERDTGISAYIGNNVSVFSKNTITIDMFGSAKYRNYDYGADDHVAVVHTEGLPKLAALFLTSAIHKVANAGQFHYGRNFYASDADELTIMLPSAKNKPDYIFMETLISAVQKLVIADVVSFSHDKIYAAKSVVEHNKE